MISFFVDTSLSYIRLALFRDDILIDFIDEYCDKNLSSLFDLRVKDIFDRNSISFFDVEKILAVTGPGSFTGIRIGLTFAKVLGMSLKKDIIPISELEVLASTDCCSKFIIPLIDARRGYVYTGVYDNSFNNVYNDKYVFLDDFLTNIDYDDISFVSFDSFCDLSIVKPSIDFQRIYSSFCDRNAVNYNSIVPNYLKDTEAEENLKKKMFNDN